MATEGPLDLENEALLLGSQEDIAAIIRDSARILVFIFLKFYVLLLHS